ncbi:sodium- and chloride-dependent glycine transporter 1 isoform X2 [Anoplolepis gracilipes]|uniref:sodium- and chloride-dependent glycine transporter 1 isoform X2 n=1 Tax=Anoplolepis gracilipes TaxID=354296 RepID=UPI003BA38C04
MTESKKTSQVSFELGGALVDRPDEPKRGSWANQIEFVLSCIGYAVGIGNVWRFPLFIYRNGGGAFLIPFILMLFTMGLPIFFLELCMGQYTGLGPVKAFSRMAPAFHGLGYCMLVVILLVMIYYMIIVAWTLFYTFASFFPKLAWAYCDNDFNSNDCYSGLEDITCQKSTNSNSIFYNKSCMAIHTVCSRYGYFDGGNTTHCFQNGQAKVFGDIYNRTLSSEEYFRDYVLGIHGATWEDFGGIRWELFGCLTLAWIVCFLCLIRGIQTVGKVVYFTALFPYVILTALLIRGVTLDGADEGILWYIMPDFSTLTDAKMWADAASQVFYSLGISCGSLVTLASYSNFSNNCHRDAIFVTFTNLFTSVFAGFVIFSILGFLARQMQMPIKKVVQQNPEGLAFIAYPEAVVRMPLPNLWAILFFFMLFILGLGSQFAGVQAINTAILDRRPDLQKYESLVILGICVTCWLLAIPMVFGGGIYLFKLMDWHTASWAILLIGFAEIVVPSWLYGCNKFLSNLAEMKMRFGRFLHGYWWLCWVILAPFTCLGSYGPSYIFPVWASVIGIGIGLATLVPLPVFFFVQVWKAWKAENLWSIFQSSPLWKAAEQKNMLDNGSANTAVINPTYVSSDKE